MLKGLAAGRPIIARDFGWARAVIQRFGVGAAVDIFQTKEFAAHLCEALDASATYKESEATKRLLAFHNPKNFTETMLDEVRRRAGRPELQPPLTWDWVLDALEPARRALI